MFHRQFVPMLAVAAVLSGGNLNLRAGENDSEFTLTFTGPDVLVGPANGRVGTDYFVTLTHDGDGEGAQGWSLGVTADNGRITGITTEGTAGSPSPTGYYVAGLGFQISGVTNGPGNEGAFTAVALCFSCEALLPTNSTHHLARIQVDGIVAHGGSEVTLRYTDGLRGGGGLPVSLVLIQAGRNVGASYRQKTIRLEPGIGGFLRADSNNDGRIDISDGIFLLNHLFAGGPDPQCEPAADMNADNVKDISDAIFLLNHLFAGGRRPPLPHPVCGPDPAGEVCASAFCGA